MSFRSMTTSPIFPEQLYQTTFPNNLWMDLNENGNFTLSPKQESWLSRAKRFFTFEQNPAILRVRDRLLSLQTQCNEKRGRGLKRLKTEIRNQGYLRCWHLVRGLADLKDKRIGLPNALSRLILKVINFFRRCFGKKPIVLQDFSSIFPTFLFSAFDPSYEEITTCPFKGELLNPQDSVRKSNFQKQIYRTQLGLNNGSAILLCASKPAKPAEAHEPTANLSLQYDKQKLQFELVCQTLSGASFFHLEMETGSPDHKTSYLVNPDFETRIIVKPGTQYTCRFADQDLCRPLLPSERTVTFRIMLNIYV